VFHNLKEGCKIYKGVCLSDKCLLSILRTVFEDEIHFFTRRFGNLYKLAPRCFILYAHKNYFSSFQTKIAINRIIIIALPLLKSLSAFVLTTITLLFQVCIIKQSQCRHV
jgi:hypothetical protein